MRIRVRLPQRQPEQYDWPTRCPQEGCDGRHCKAQVVQNEIIARTAHATL